MSTETPGYWKNKGDGFFKLKNYSEAIACYMRVIESDPENSEAWHCMGVSYENLEKYDEATKSFRQEWRIHGDRIKQKHNPDMEKRIKKPIGSFSVQNYLNRFIACISIQLFYYGPDL